MASFRSWFGAILGTASFFLFRQLLTGWTAPSFLALVISFVYLWHFVLKVQKFLPEVEALAAAAKPAAPVPPPKEAEPGPSTSPSEVKAQELQASHEKPRAVAPAKEAAPPAEAAPVPSSAPSQEPAGAEPEAATPSDLHRVQQAAVAEAHRTDLQVQEVEEVPPISVADQPTEEEPTEPQGSGSPAAAAAVNEWDEDEELERRRREALEAEDREFEDPEHARELRLEGNELFKAGRVHDAREAYSEALHLTPQSDKSDRAVLLANRAACLQKLGRWDEVVRDCSQAIELDPSYLKAWTRRSAAYEALSKWHDAVEDLKKAIELDPSLRSKEYKRQAFLEARAHEQFEKDKDEMMGKLKELGNTVLGKFGMSLDNFKMEQDPNTGSYSMKFGNGE